MAKYLVEWESVYDEGDDTNGTAVVEAETPEEAMRIYEANHRMTIVYNVTEYTESEDENV